MTEKVMKHPGLNLASAHGDDDRAAETVMFGFWAFLMSDAILFGMVFATYAPRSPVPPADRVRTTSTTSRASSSRRCCCWSAASRSAWPRSR